MKVHLVVLQHGLWGTPFNLAELEREISSRSAAVACSGTHGDLPGKVRIYNSHSSFFTRVGAHATMDGVDECGERLFDAVRAHIDILRVHKGEEITHLSLVGYSLGGLITRYAVGKMEQQGWFSNQENGNLSVTPVKFFTIATPHLGVWKDPAKSWCFAPLWNFFVPKMASLTGRQLSFKDKDHGKRPLLINLCDPGLPFSRD